jgi:hypothetical protein
VRTVHREVRRDDGAHAVVDLAVWPAYVVASVAIIPGEECTGIVRLSDRGKAWRYCYSDGGFAE